MHSPVVRTICGFLEEQYEGAGGKPSPLCDSQEATQQWLKATQMAIRTFGVKSHDDRVKFLSKIFNREITTTLDLNWIECSVLITASNSSFLSSQLKEVLREL